MISYLRVSELVVMMGICRGAAVRDIVKLNMEGRVWCMSVKRYTEGRVYRAFREGRRVCGRTG